MALNSSLSGRTRIYAVLGHPVAHSLSPAMHNPALQALGLDAHYCAFDVEPSRLLDVLHSMAHMGFGGVNLTIPHKEIAFQGLSRLADSARLSGSVNTIRFLPNAELEGHSSDGHGLVHALQEDLAESLAGRRVLLLGCGGAGRAAALRAAQDSASEIRLANRSPARAERLAAEIQQRFPGIPVLCAPAWPPPPDFIHPADLILQSTSLGMKDESEFGFCPEHFRPGQALFDMTYLQPETPFMRIARAAGARTANGLSMLLHQGARSLEIWTGQPAPLEVMRRALRHHVYGTLP